MSVVEQCKTAQEIDKWCESMLSTDLYHDDDFSWHYSAMHAMYESYTAAVWAAVYNHVDQVLYEAYRLLSEDDSWTKYPVRYKRTKKAIEKIVAPALEGTCCHIWYSDDPNSDYIAIDHNIREVYVPNEQGRWTIKLCWYGDEYGSCEQAKSRVYENDRTIDEVLFAAFERNNIKRQIEMACKEYKAKVERLYEPLRCLYYSDFKKVVKEANASF